MSTNEGDDANKKYIEFVDFLDERRTDSKDDVTHTRVGKPSGKYVIKKSDMKQFQKLYCDVCNIKKSDGTPKYILNISEKQKDVGPLMTDYDFEFDSEHTERQYGIDVIKYIVGILNTVICQCIVIDKADVVAYVTEKSAPSIVRDIDNSDDIDDETIAKAPIKKVKDGFHICYICPFTKEQRYMIYDKLSKIITKEDKLSAKIPFKNTYENIIDISTVHRNNWMLYGSRKTLKKPFSEPYKLTHIYDYNVNEIDVSEYTFDALVDRFCVRQYDKKYVLQTRDELLKDEEEIAEEYGLRKKQQEPSKNLGETTSKSRQNKTYTSHSTELEIVHKLVDLLSPERARGEEDWIRVGWALHNIDDSLFDDFVKFSQKCKDAYDYNGCVDAWKRAKKDGYGIASLRWWAMQDNKDGYIDLMWNSIDKRVANIESGKSVDIAKVVHQIYNQIFQCASIGNNHDGWYEYQGNRWVHIDGASSIRNEISEKLVHKIIDMSHLYSNQLKETDTERMDVEYAQKKATELLKIASRLRETAPLNSVITECEHKFINPKFAEKLNDNRYLMGFNNGVYDLRNNEFRQGFPSDYITYTTGYDWEEFTGDEPVFKQINDYMKKIIPNQNKREYTMRYIASCARGGNTDQQMHFWTGKGCHSGDTPIMMFNGEMKCAKDISIGDKLMGDDSKPRRVRGLFSGTQDMYEVILSDGTSYTANADHRMALKSVYDGDIRFDDVSKTYIVTYHKYEDDIPVKHEKYFRVKDSTDENAHANAIKYLEKKKMDNNVIKMGTIIPVKIINYINAMDDSIKKDYEHFRNKIEFEQRPIIIDPYKLGTTMGTTSIPTQYKFNSEQIRLKLLAGIVDKFGSIEDGIVTITAQNRVFMNDCIFVCRSLGYNVVVISPEKIQIVGNLKEIPTRILKLYEPSYNKSDNLTYKFKINGVGNGRFYGFSVDKNERYVLYNFIVTYNSNGKSLFTDLIRKAFGNDYCKTMDPTVLTRKKVNASNATPELADKHGVRLIFLSEPEEDDVIYSSNMKKMTGATDEICARPLYGNEFTYVPQFKMVMVCNDLPTFGGKDDGTWRRPRVNHFDSTFVDGEPQAPDQFKKDKLLEEKMKGWYAPFMWLLLKVYYPKYCKDGLMEPDEVRIATSKYRHDNDVYSEFIDTSYDITKNSTDKVSLSAFYTEFKNWYRDAFSGEKCPTRNLVKNYIERSNNLKLVDGNIIGMAIKKLDLDEIK